MNRISQMLVTPISKLIQSDLEPDQILARILSDTEVRSGLTQFNFGSNQMLLESCEISSKDKLKSIIMLQAAIRICCQGNEIVITAKTKSGEVALAHLFNQLGDCDEFQIVSKENSKGLIQELKINLTRNNFPYEEDEKLLATSSISVLREIKRSFNAPANPRYGVFLCGVFAFDYISSFEQLDTLPFGDNTCPDYVFYLAQSLLVIDHKSNSKRLICNHFGSEKSGLLYNDIARDFSLIANFIEQLKTERLSTQSSAQNLDTENNQQTKVSTNSMIEDTNPLSQPTVNISDEAFNQIVLDLKQHVRAGNAFQIVPSRTFSLPCLSPIESYRQLKTSNPSPYLFYQQDESFSLFGASPESALKFEPENRLVTLYPIAGTRPRGQDELGQIDVDLDARMEADLRMDQKEIAEHMMLVDLARNDIARISEPGSVAIPRLMNVDRYSQVMHLVSCVTGKLRKNLDALAAYQACMNMGTLTGAPKIRATQLIQQTEKFRRGSYGGAVGYLNGDGEMDTCIVIRAAFCRDQMAYIQAGAGVVFDSVAQSETNETRAKANAVIMAITLANQALNNKDLGKNVV